MKYYANFALLIATMLVKVQADARQDIANLMAGCNKFATAGLRAVFHECGTFRLGDPTPGGCDGSLQFELERTGNAGVKEVATALKGIATRNSISFMDSLVLGGAVAYELCGGNRIEVKLGRLDTATAANPDNRLPTAQESGANITRIMSTGMGFTPAEIVALVEGSHSIGQVFSRPSNKNCVVPVSFLPRYFSSI